MSSERIIEFIPNKTYADRFGIGGVILKMPMAIYYPLDYQSFMSWEVYRDSFKADVYAIGWIICFLLLGTDPDWENIKKIKKHKWKAIMRKDADVFLNCAGNEIQRDDQRSHR